MRNSSLLATLCAVLLALGVACDSSNNNLVNDDGGVADADPLAPDADPSAPDADPNRPDGGPQPGCTPGATQCTNCVDDDDDGLFDGFDPECTSADDNIEGSFATGISGDNIDQYTQDCFFDGNSGGGDDKCAYHTCCLTDVARDGTCNAGGGPAYDPADCTVSAECIANCAPAAYGGCDCFGCCTVCEGSECRDIAVNPAISPECSQEVYDDPTKCKPCAKTTECGGEVCGGETCVLCPGQDPSDLPAGCNQTPTCPTGVTPCSSTSDCSGSDFCAGGCCTSQIG